jgi:hypothetical protein
LTAHPLIDNTFTPSASTLGNATTNTADFSPNDLRVDYVLPSRAGFTILDGGIFWPLPPHPLAPLVTNANASDHKLVWLDLQPVPFIGEAVQNLTAGLSNGAIVIAFRAASGYAYHLEETAAVATGPWTGAPGSPVIVGEDLTATATVPVALPGRRFFRVVAAFAP